jgi:hypothetical protein
VGECAGVRVRLTLIWCIGGPVRLDGDHSIEGAQQGDEDHTHVASRLEIRGTCTIFTLSESGE